MTVLAIAIPAPAPILALPTGEEIIDMLKAAGIRAYVLMGKVGFSLERDPDWDTYDAWVRLKHSPGWMEAVERYYLDR